MRALVWAATDNIPSQRGDGIVIANAGEDVVGISAYTPSNNGMAFEKIAAPQCKSFASLTC